MANTLTNFLVGVGLDFDESSTRKVDGALEGVKSRALQVGAVLAGAFGTKALTADFAAAYDRVGKFGEVFGVSAGQVTALGRALQHEGGSLESFLGQLSGIEEMRAGLLQGDAEFIAAAGRAGIDPSIITNAENATEAYIALADQFERMGGQQRLNAAAALGLDEASIRLLSRGSANVRELVAAELEMRPVTDKMTESAARFNDETQDLFTNIGGFADRISVKLLPEINGVVSGMNDWIAVNREFINQGLDRVLDPIADNFEEVAAAGALLASGGLLSGLGVMARYIPIIGSALSVAATAASRLTFVGAGVAAGAALWDWTPDDFEKTFGVRPPDWLFTPINQLGDGAPSPGAAPGRGRDAPVPQQYSEGPPEPDSNARRGLTDSERERGVIDTPWGPMNLDEMTPEERRRLLDITTPAGDGSPTTIDVPDLTAPPAGDDGDPSDLGVRPGPPSASTGRGSPRNLTVNLTLDGQIIEQRVIAINERQDKQALLDIETSVRA